MMGKTITETSVELERPRHDKIIEVLKLIIAARSLEAVGNAVFKHAQFTLGARVVGLTRYFPGTDEVEVHIFFESQDGPRQQFSRLPLRDFDDLTPQQRGEIQIVSDIPLGSSALPEDLLKEQSGILYLAVPVRVKDELIATIYLGMAPSIDLAREDETNVADLADLVGLAILRLDEIHSLESRKRDLEYRMAQRATIGEQEYLRRTALGEIELAINEPSELEDVLDRIARVTAQLLPATGGVSVILWDAEVEEFYIRSSWVSGGAANTVFERVRRKEGATRWIVDHKEALLVPDIRSGPFGTTQMLSDLGYQAYAGVPLLVEGEVLGVLYAVDPHPRDYSEEDVNFLTSLANRAAVAISKVELIEEIRKANDLLEEQTQELQFLNQELREFAYIVSHDLKAPLRGVKTLAEWISNDYKDVLDSQGRELLDLLVDRVRRMHDLIDGILRYSKVSRGQGALKPIDLEELIGETVELLSPDDDIQVRVVDPMPVIEGDEIRLRQVFQNLIGNAVKYNESADPLIRVGCVEEGDRWRFFVADNGPGIDPRLHERIFQLFQTGEKDNPERGSGVGLAVVKKIVNTWGGRVWLESAVGEGSTFYFTIPKEA
jgi:signal transduction histidine kinase